MIDAFKYVLKQLSCRQTIYSMLTPIVTLLRCSYSYVKPNDVWPRDNYCTNVQIIRCGWTGELSIFLLCTNSIYNNGSLQARIRQRKVPEPILPFIRLYIIWDTSIVCSVVLRLETRLPWLDQMQNPKHIVHPGISILEGSIKRSHLSIKNTISWETNNRTGDVFVVVPIVEIDGRDNRSEMASKWTGPKILGYLCDQRERLIRWS